MNIERFEKQMNFIREIDKEKMIKRQWLRQYRDAGFDGEPQHA